MKKMWLGAAIAIVTACGGSNGSGSQNVVSGFKLDYRAGDVIFDVNFSQDFSLNLEVASPIKNYGSISFIPGDNQYGFSIRAILATNAWLDGLLTIEKTNRLPNGAPFPSYVGSELGKYQFTNQDKFKGILYLGTEPKKKYLGSAIALDFMSKNFPAGIAISQSLYNKKNERVGVATVYGPQVDKDGNLLQPGGLFAAANLSTLVPSMGVMGSETEGTADVAVYTDGVIEAYAPNGEKISDEKALDFLIQFRREGQKAGVIRRK